MQEVDNWKHWLLPVLGLNATGTDRDKYMAGNSPEMNPLDTSLNQDIHTWSNDDRDIRQPELH